jgi:hypothetical protein
VEILLLSFPLGNTFLEEPGLHKNLLILTHTSLLSAVFLLSVQLHG